MLRLKPDQIDDAADTDQSGTLVDGLAAGGTGTVHADRRDLRQLAVRRDRDYLGDGNTGFVTGRVG